MRIFKDLDMVEYLGSGMPRILKAYSKESFAFSSHFVRMTLPISMEALELEKNGIEVGSVKKSPIMQAQLWKNPADWP